MLRIASTCTAAAGLLALLWAIGLVVLAATWSSTNDEWFEKTDRGEAAPQAVIGLVFFSIVVWVCALLIAHCSPHSNSKLCSLLYYSTHTDMSIVLYSCIVQAGLTYFAFLRFRQGIATSFAPPGVDPNAPPAATGAPTVGAWGASTQGYQPPAY